VQWFKLYAEIATDPKVQTMPEVMRWRLISLYCLCCSADPAALKEHEIAHWMGITRRQLDDTRRLFVAKGFIGPDWGVPKFAKRQAPADPTAAERMRRYRARYAQRNVDNGSRARQARGEENHKRGDQSTENIGESGRAPPPPVTLHPNADDAARPEPLPAEALEVAQLAADWGGSTEWSAWALCLCTDFPPGWIAEALATARKKDRLTQSYVEGILASYRERGGSDAERRGVRGGPRAPALGAVEEPEFIPDTLAGAAVKAMYRKGSRRKEAT
jgi:hypothetical protein